MVKRPEFKVLIAAAALVAASPAHAGPVLTAQEILEQFNLVVLGDMVSGHDVEGRTYVGGNLSGNGTFNMGDPQGTYQSPASAYAALVVKGSITSGNVNMNNGGSVQVGGNLSASNLNLNGTGQTITVGGNLNTNLNLNGNSQTLEVVNNITSNVSVNGATVRYGGTVTGSLNNVNGGVVQNTPVTPQAIPDFAQVLVDLAGDLKNTAAEDASVAVASNRATFTITDADTDDFALLTIADGAGLFASIGEVTFLGLDTVDTLVINVGGLSIAFAENFLVSASAGLGDVASKVIWNFYEATTVTLGTEFFGSLLAPNAALSNNNAINGSVVAGSFIQGGEVHLPTFAGDLPTGEPETPPTTDVPEPGAALLLVSGLAGLAAARRRSRA